MGLFGNVRPINGAAAKWQAVAFGSCGEPEALGTVIHGGWRRGRAVKAGRMRCGD